MIICVTSGDFPPVNSRSTLKTLAKENLIEGSGLKQWIHNHNPDILNTSTQAILCIRDCILADCFIGLIRLEAALKKLLDCDYHNFCQQAIAVFNKRFTEFDDDAYILYFFYDTSNYEEQPFSEELHNNKLPEEERLKIEELLNLDAANFTKDLNERD
ncbi:33166_t:CDS:2, partial [Racocetra persica]